MLKNIRVPIRPHFGVLGLAPSEADYVDSIPPHYVGGNIDNWRIGKGATMYYPVAVAGKMDAEPVETVSIVGPLCTPLDRLADRVALPEAGPGDVIAVFLAGAYGASASPAAFLGHGPAAEIVAGG